MPALRQWVHQTGGGLPRPFWYLWMATLVNRAGSFVLIVLAIYLTRERGLTESFAGLVIGLWSAGAAIGTLLGGVLADRWGRKPILLIAMYGSAAIMLLFGVAQRAPEIALAAAALGLASEASRPALSALIIDIVAERDRLRAFSLNYWVVNVGFAVAATTAGLLAGVDYLLLFVINATTTAAAATVVAVMVREPSPARPDRTRGPARIPGSGRRDAGLRAVFADRTFMAFVGTNVLTALVFLQHLSTLPMAMSRDGLSPSTYGSVIALNGALIVAGQLFVPRLLRERGRAATLATAAVIIGAGFGLTALARSAWLYAAAVLVWTVGEMLNSPANSATNAELSPAQLRGRYQGVFSLSWSVAGFAAPILGAAMLQYAGDAVLWLCCFAAGLVVAVIHLTAGPARERRTAQLRRLERLALRGVHEPAAARTGHTPN